MEVSVQVKGIQCVIIIQATSTDGRVNVKVKTALLRDKDSLVQYRVMTVNFLCIAALLKESVLP
jgi:hypothetical protein